MDHVTFAQTDTVIHIHWEKTSVEPTENQPKLHVNIAPIEKFVTLTNMTLLLEHLEIVIFTKKMIK